MGQSWTKPEKPVVPKPFDQPWREVPWGKKREDFDYVKKYKPQSAEQRLRILLHGPPGSGKSSFINSVDSALRGRIAVRALAATGYNSSFTKEFRSFKIQTETPGVFYPFIFNDTMGVEQGANRGVDVQTMEQILKGHVNEGCKLLPGSIPNGDFYKEIPSINDRVHVLVCTVPATTSNMIDDDSVHKMKEIREAARELGIPQVAILTRIDEACPYVKEDIKNVYKSKTLKTQMENLSVILGIPMNCIFLVKNYSEETETNEETDGLILNIMRQIINYGDDFLNDLGPRMDTRSLEV